MVTLKKVINFEHQIIPLHKGFYSLILQQFKGKKFFKGWTHFYVTQEAIHSR